MIVVAVVLMVTISQVLVTLSYLGFLNLNSGRIRFFGGRGEPCVSMYWSQTADRAESWGKVRIS